MKIVHSELVHHFSFSFVIFLRSDLIFLNIASRTGISYRRSEISVKSLDGTLKISLSEHPQYCVSIHSAKLKNRDILTKINSLDLVLLQWHSCSLKLRKNFYRFPNTSALFEDFTCRDYSGNCVYSSPWNTNACCEKLLAYWHLTLRIWDLKIAHK